MSKRFFFQNGMRFHSYENAYNQRLSQTEIVTGGLDYKRITPEPHNNNNNNLLDENKPASNMAGKPSWPRWTQEANNKRILGTKDYLDRLTSCF